MVQGDFMGFSKFDITLIYALILSRIVSVYFQPRSNLLCQGGAVEIFSTRERKNTTDYLDIT